MGRPLYFYLPTFETFHTLWHSTISARIHTDTARSSSAASVSASIRMVTSAPREAVLFLLALTRVPTLSGLVPSVSVAAVSSNNYFPGLSISDRSCTRTLPFPDALLLSMRTPSL